MEVELQEIHDFVHAIPAFAQLPEETLRQVVQAMSIRYIRRGKSLPSDSVTNPVLYIVRQGAIKLFSDSNILVDMLGEGDICSLYCLPETNGDIRAYADEDTLVYCVPCRVIKSMSVTFPSIASLMQKNPTDRLRRAVESQEKDAAHMPTLTNTTIEKIMSDAVVSTDINASIQEAARIMTQNHVSSIIVLDNDKLVGIVTDRDLRQRCLAPGLSADSKVTGIMTEKVIHVAPSAIAFDALMLMTRKHIHHLPVVRNDRIKGIITATDLIRHEGRHSVYITSSIRKAEQFEALTELSRQVPALQLQLVNMGCSAEHIGNAISSVTSAFTRRLIRMAESKFGPPPVPYAWVAGGSQARREQMSHSDQDNGLIISDEISSGDESWFTDFVNFVCDGLNACGYFYCPGEAMAKNPRWRQPVKVWRSYFENWIKTPRPMALMLSSIFFDLRTIYGEKSFLKQIQHDILLKARNSQLFLAHMTANALHHRVPLGFFRNFVLVNGGQNKDTMDLKHNGLTPISDMARIYALAESIPNVNTAERLKKASGTHSLSVSGANNLLDAYAFISRLRMQHQARQIQRGEQADNFISPEKLSALEREHLKDAFKVIQTMQLALENRFKAHHMG